MDPFLAGFPIPTTVAAVLRQYPSSCHPVGIESLGGHGGFSGAELWRLRTTSGLLCLRRWPEEHPAPERLRFIHRVLLHAAARGCNRLPLPIATQSGETFCSDDGRLWELTPWLAGAADYHAGPSAEKLQAALTALGEFHCATSDFLSPAPVEVSPGMLRRREQLKSLLAGRLERLRHAVRPLAGWAGLESLARELIDLFPRRQAAVMRQLELGCNCRVRLQPCLRDIWHDHVLFDGSRVTGLIDFGAMAIETPSADVARLTGSLAADDRQAWSAALAAYAAVRPLSPDEQALVAAFDSSAVLMAGLQWLEWVYLEGREFAEPERVMERVRGWVERLHSSIR